ncbi:MAG TPA: adenylate/guanylate cyclase domain-containing protein [bacterium]|nr:adenylate/guanylate cyclase domain-containing protein [bacterium]
MLERKVVTILFADLVGSTVLAGELDPEELRDLMARYRDAVSAEVRLYGGTMEKFIGDAPMAVFGVPQAHEDDPERAVRAAFGIRDALQRLPTGGLDVRIGVHTGDVVADATAAERGEFMVTGEAVNLAQRLQAAADPGEIFVGARTWKDTKAVVEFEEIPPLNLKGVASPVTAYRAVRLHEAPPARLAGPVGFVGRSYELALLELLYERVCGERRPHLVTLIGPPGIGKTRLVEEFHARISAREPRPILRGDACKPYGEAWLYCPIAGVILAEMPVELWQISELDPLIECATATMRRICAENGVSEEHASRLARVFVWSTRRDCGLDPPPSREELFRGWRFLLEVRGARSPVVAAFENLQWSSDEPLDFIESLPSKLAGRPVLVIAVARPELLERRPHWGGGINATTIQLGPLAAEETSALAARVLDGPAHPALLATVEERAEGNPHFLIEFIRMMVEDGLLARRDGQWEAHAPRETLKLPDTVHGVLAARIDRLPPTEKRALLLASYAAYSRTFWDRPLQRMGDLDRAEIDTALEGLCAKGLIVEDPMAVSPASLGFGVLADTRQYTFSHMLLREVAHEMVPKAQRPRLHLAFADWLEEVTKALPWSEKTHVQIIAHHLFEAWRLTQERGRADTALAERALSACLVAGEIQCGCAANREAVECLRRALQIARTSLPERETEVHARFAEIEGMPVEAV